jgi:hypothetical protein
MITTPELPVHDRQQRLNRSRYNIKQRPNGEKSLQFLDHLSALGHTTAVIERPEVSYAVHTIVGV